MIFVQKFPLLFFLLKLQLCIKFVDFVQSLFVMFLKDEMRNLQNYGATSWHIQVNKKFYISINNLFAVGDSNPIDPSHPI